MNKVCPTKSGLQIFLSGEFSANEKDEVEGHLVDCPDCRRNLSLIFAENNEETEIFAAPELLKEKVKSLSNLQIHPNSNSEPLNKFGWLKGYRLQIGFATVLIAAFGLLGIMFLPNQQLPESTDVFRADPTDRNSFKLVSPENEAKLVGERIEFRWEEMQNVKSYTLVLSDEKGDIIKEVPQTETSLDTTVSALGIARERYYFWHIRAKFLDGLIAESESRKISVER